MAAKRSRIVKVSKGKLKLIVFGWCGVQFILLYIYMGLMAGTGIGLISTPLVWQVMTELGYGFANRLGYHSTPEGTAISDGRGGRLPFPDFIPNTSEYNQKRLSLTRTDKVLQIIFALSCAMLIGIFGILELIWISTWMLHNEILFIICWLGAYFLLLGVWKGYQKLFAKIFRLEVAWYENSRPVFRKRMKIKKL